ncbi:leukocyte immunoglobulin-like receptor subfamily B member 4 [Loxodonta africana]|uniref:leukocyte immunoglobulin-like receptor subfamily B member 4 n=1 Tax=Loxodonta africana TaxID=9785 RepID=UPI0030CF8AAE
MQGSATALTLTAFLCLGLCQGQRNQVQTGQFQCAYHSSSGWSECSDPLLLVVTGAYSKPSLSAHPSHLVVSGGDVSLSCSSRDRMDTFHLLENREAYPSQQRKSEFSAGRHQATFPVGPVSTSHGCIYRCCGSS